MYNALTVQTSFAGSEETLTLEVAHHVDDGLVRAISWRPTDGVVRGSEVLNTGQSIQVPVGDETLGRVFNTVGQCLNLDEGEEFHAQEHWGIHRSAPAFDQLDPKTEMSETGVKVVDLLTPYVQGARMGWFGSAGAA